MSHIPMCFSSRAVHRSKIPCTPWQRWENKMSDLIRQVFKPSSSVFLSLVFLDCTVVLVLGLSWVVKQWFNELCMAACCTSTTIANKQGQWEIAMGTFLSHMETGQGLLRLWVFNSTKKQFQILENNRVRVWERMFSGKNRPPGALCVWCRQ